MNKIIQLCALLALGGCVGNDYEALTLRPAGDHFVAKGTIDSTTPEVFRTAFAENPDIRKIVMLFVPGSADDESNLEASRLIRSNQIATIIPEDGLVASGGADMFLAGVRRDVKTGACIGVHSWADGDGTEGKDLPRDDAEHQLYLDYYNEMGIAADFYWYTLQAADAEDIHYMSNAEIERYGVATSSIAGNIEATMARCEEIGAAAEDG